MFFCRNSGLLKVARKLAGQYRHPAVTAERAHRLLYLAGANLVVSEALLRMVTITQTTVMIDILADAVLLWTKVLPIVSLLIF